jgi:hypothetical protein
MDREFNVLEISLAILLAIAGTVAVMTVVMG